MADFVQIPVERLETETYNALLEEFASRDGTDYGEVELSLNARVNNLRRQIDAGELALVYDAESEAWDILSQEKLNELQQ